MACRVCETRRPRRLCPGVGGKICSVCCGTERENTVNCPLDCEYLREARGRERPRELDPENIPNGDIHITESFLHEQAVLLSALMRGLTTAALGMPGVVDFDVREALDSLVRTYRTLQSGLYYESKPANVLAARIHELVQSGLQEYRKSSAERAGIQTVRDADVLGALVFLERLELRLNNGRKRGRAFLDFLRQNIGAGEGAAIPGGSSLVLP